LREKKWARWFSQKALGCLSNSSGSQTVKYRKIFLGTPPMDKFAGDPDLSIDPEDGYN